MRCPHCDQPIDEGATFCPWCHRSTGDPTPAAPAPGAVPGPIPTAPGSIPTAPAAAGPAAGPGPVPVPPASATQPGAPVPPPPAPPASQPAGGGRPGPARHRVLKGLLIGIAAVVVFAVVAAVVSGFNTFTNVGDRITDAEPSPLGDVLGSFDLPEANDGNGSSREPSGQTAPSAEGAAGTYYAFWSYDGTVWSYMYVLGEDGEGVFRLEDFDSLADVSKSAVDANTYEDPLLWKLDDNELTLSNPRGSSTLPDGPNHYTVKGGAGSRVLTPSGSYAYPDEVFYEDFDEALANATID